jgi:hypothetical protein
MVRMADKSVVPRLCVATECRATGYLKFTSIDWRSGALVARYYLSLAEALAFVPF